MVEMPVAVRDRAGGILDDHYQFHGFEQTRHPPLGRVQRFLGQLQVGNISRRAPHSREHAIFDDAPLTAQQVPAAALPVNLRDLDSGEVISASDSVQVSLPVTRVR